jgi:hypothetical protein
MAITPWVAIISAAEVHEAIPLHRRMPSARVLFKVLSDTRGWSSAACSPPRRSSLRVPLDCAVPPVVDGAPALDLL